MRLIFLFLMALLSHVTVAKEPVTATALTQPTPAQALAPSAMTLQMSGVVITNLGWESEGCTVEPYMNCLNVDYPTNGDAFQDVIDKFNRTVKRMQAEARIRGAADVDDDPVVKAFAVATDDPDKLRVIATLPFVVNLTLTTDTGRPYELPTEQDRIDQETPIDLTRPWDSHRGTDVINITKD